MCQFFSCVSDGDGKVMYFDAEMRKKIVAGKTGYQDTDSHTSIAHFHGYRGREEDTLNKYEFNPLTEKFVIDQLNTVDDSDMVREFCHALDWKGVVPELTIKPIIHPLRDISTPAIREHEKKLLKSWASVGYSVGDSVWDSVGDSVWYSVRDSVWYSVGYSVGYSVWDSVWASVWASVGAYFSSFFTTCKTDKLQPCIELWELGFVPSFDGKTWRLHAGPAANIVYEWVPED